MADEEQALHSEQHRLLAVVVAEGAGLCVSGGCGCTSPPGAAAAPAAPAVATAVVVVVVVVVPAPAEVVSVTLTAWPGRRRRVIGCGECGVWMFTSYSRSDSGGGGVRGGAAGCVGCERMTGDRLRTSGKQLELRTIGMA